jgi:hypothetical protein
VLLAGGSYRFTPSNLTLPAPCYPKESLICHATKSFRVFKRWNYKYQLPVFGSSLA